MFIDLEQSYDAAILLAPDKQPVKLKQILTEALMLGVCPNEEKLKRWGLYKRIRDHRAEEFDADEIQYLSELALRFPTGVAGQTHDFLHTPYVPVAPAPGTEFIELTVADADRLRVPHFKRGGAFDPDSYRAVIDT